MTNKATMYGLMTIAAVLLVAMAFAGAGAAMGGNPVPLTDSSYKVLVVDDVSGEVAATSGTSLGTTVYLLEDADDWNAVAVDDTYNGKVLVLGDNLDFSETVTDNMMTYKFTGKIYGNGYLFDGFTNTTSTKSNVGLIREAGDGLYLNYVQMTNSSIGSAKSSIRNGGSLVGYISGDNPAEVSVIGCSIYNGSIANVSAVVGGLVGCISNGPVGIVTLTLNYSSVYNTTINASGVNIGGLVGYEKNNTVIISNCTVCNCWILAGLANVYQHGAGLIGTAENPYKLEIQDSTVTNCNIRGSGNVGALVGYAGIGTENYFGTISILNCSAVNCNLTTTMTSAGSLVGISRCRTTVGSESTVIDCSAKDCNVTAITGFAGGLIGSADGSSIINCVASNCNVYGTDAAATGGILGGDSGDVYTAIFTNCIAGTSTKNVYLSPNSGNNYLNGTSATATMTGCSANITDTPFDLQFPTKEEIQVFPASKLPYVYVTYNVAPGVAGSPYSSAKQTVDMPYKRNTAFGSIVSGNSVNPIRLGYDLTDWNRAAAGNVVSNEVVTAAWGNGPVKLTGTSAMNTYNVLVVDEVTGAVSTKHPNELDDNGAKTVYLIESADHWNAVAIDESFNGAVLILGDNLDFSGLSNMMTYKFTGKIYGNGYLIDGFTNTTSTTDNVGLIREAGDGLYMNYVQMTNSSFKAPSKNNAGNLIGIINGSTDAVSVKIIGSSVYNGSITDVKTYIGGVIGKMTGSSANLIVNHTTVYNTTLIAEGEYVGGLFGIISGGTSGASIVIYNCCIDDCWIVSPGGCGAGLCGLAECSYVTIEKTMVSNSTIKTISNACAGGLLGPGYYSDANTKLTIDNCNVSDCNISGRGYVGGLMGFPHTNVSITHCNVIDCDLAGRDYNDIGGLIGHNYGATVENCTVLRCNVAGPVGYRIGGLVGYTNTDANALKIDYCYAGTEGNELNVTSGKGLAGDGKTLGSHCANASLVDAWDLTFPTMEEIQVFPASKLPYVYVTYNAAPGVAGSPYSSAKQTVDMPYKCNTAFGSIESGNSVSPVRSGFTLKGWNNAPATVTQDTEVYAIWADNSQQYTPSSSKQTGSTVILSEGQTAPTAYATATPTVAPTVKPTEQPATPTVIATEKPTTQATQQSPAPFVGLLAGLGATAVLLRLRK